MCETFGANNVLSCVCSALQVVAQKMSYSCSYLFMEDMHATPRYLPGTAFIYFAYM